MQIELNQVKQIGKWIDRYTYRYKYMLWLHWNKERSEFLPGIIGGEQRDLKLGFWILEWRVWFIIEDVGCCVSFLWCNINGRDQPVFVMLNSVKYLTDSILKSD